jgi:predicted glycosyltransferase
VILVTGGPQIETQLPKHVTVVKLPELQMDRKFKDLYSSDKSASLDHIKNERQKKLLAIVQKERPDIFFLELFPFGRQAFRFELDPVLEAIRSNRIARCGVISSVRDILVEKEKPKHEQRALERLNTFFDAVLVHSDPNLITLKETFLRFDEIRIPVIHTGYIAQKPPHNARSRIRKQLGIGEDDVMIVASAGGGSVGKPILESTIQAFGHLKVDRRSHLYVFAGPYVPEHEFTYLKGLKKGKRIQVEKFKSDFLSYLAAAELSISMAGYNTTMNILTAGVPALVWPFGENREQRLRAERLADRGALKLIDDQDLNPIDLADIMGQTLTRTDSIETDIDLDGVVNTVQWLEGWINRNLNNS